MDSDSLVPHLDPFKDCRARLIVRAETPAVDEFLLQGRPEAFHHGVVVAIAGAAYALHGHRERICCNRRMQRVRHAPPNNTSAPCVHHACEIEKAFIRRNVSDVAQPIIVWSVSGEVTLRKIGRRRICVRTTALAMASLRSLRGAGNAWRNW